jgi:hypothetical protein
MKELKLPIIRGHLPKKRVLSMDEYLEFVQFNLKYTVDEDAVMKWKKIRAVNAPFSLK